MNSIKKIQMHLEQTWFDVKPGVIAACGGKFECA